MADNNRDFFNQLLERTLRDVCLWENFNDKKRRKIYKLTGFQGEVDVRHAFEILYLDERRKSYKTIEEMSQDYIATPEDLMALGETIATKK